MKAISFLMLMTILGCQPVLASPGSAGGKSSLRWDALDREIEDLDVQILNSRAQALTARALPGSNGSTFLAVANAQITAFELQKSALENDRARQESEREAKGEM
jgi:hypothetical protein